MIGCSTRRDVRAERTRRDAAGGSCQPGSMISRSTGTAAAVSGPDGFWRGAGFVFAIVPANSSPQATVSAYERNRCMASASSTGREATIVPPPRCRCVGAERRRNAETYSAAISSRNLRPPGPYVCNYCHPGTQPRVWGQAPSVEQMSADGGQSSPTYRMARLEGWTDGRFRLHQGRAARDHRVDR